MVILMEALYINNYSNQREFQKTNTSGTDQTMRTSFKFNKIQIGIQRIVWKFSINRIRELFMQVQKRVPGLFWNIISLLEIWSGNLRNINFTPNPQTLPEWFGSSVTQSWFKNHQLHLLFYPLVHIFKSLKLKEEYHSRRQPFDEGITLYAFFITSFFSSLVLPYLSLPYLTN